MMKLNKPNIVHQFLIACLMSLLLVIPTSAQAQCEGIDSPCTNFVEFFDEIDSIRVVNLVSNPLLEVRLIDNANLRLYMPDDLARLVDDPNQISNADQLPIVRADSEYCELLLAGFDRNPDPSISQFSSSVDIVGNSTSIYAYCTTPNLSSITEGDDGYPAVESAIYTQTDGSAALNARILPTTNSTYQRVHNVLVRANHPDVSKCPRGHNPSQAATDAILTLDDFAVQLALFIAFDDLSIDPIDTGFDRYFNQSKMWLYARDFEGIHCLLGVSDMSPYYASLSLSTHSIEAEAPHTIDFLNDLEITIDGQIANSLFSLTDEDGNNLLVPVDFRKNAIEPYTFNLAGTYTATYTVWGTPFAENNSTADNAVNAILEEPFRLTEKSERITIHITAPQIDFELQSQQRPWYLQAYFQQNGTSITLLAFTLCVMAGIPILALAIAYALSIRSSRRRILALSLIVFLVMLVVFGVLTDRLAIFW